MFDSFDNSNSCNISFSEKLVKPKDLGHICRYCKKSFDALSESIAVRDEGKIKLKLRVHKECANQYY